MPYFCTIVRRSDYQGILKVGTWNTSVSKALDVPDFRSADACSDVKRHCTNAENMSHELDIKHDVLR